MVIKVGEVVLLNVEDWEVSPDDRQTIIETIDGVVVQDFGHVEAGDKFSCRAVVSSDDKAQFFSYWHNRTLVKVTKQGSVYENMRVIIKKYSDVANFKNYCKVELEFWRV